METRDNRVVLLSPALPAPMQRGQKGPAFLLGID